MKKNQPNILEDGFEWTENFDGLQKFKEHKIRLYYNLKFICDKGGAQTRALREVYHFIKVQIDYLMKRKKNGKKMCKYFVNILDGNCCHQYMDKFKYLIDSNEKYKDIKKYIFIGDTYNFQEWFIILTKSKF